MDRRTFITATTATPLLATKAIASAQPADPLPDLVSKWFEARDRWYNFVEDNDCKHRSEAKEAALFRVRDELASIISGTKPTTLRGVAEQIRYFIAEYGECIQTEGVPGSEYILPTIKAGIDELATNSGSKT